MTTKRGFRPALLHWFSLIALLILAGACVPVDYEAPALGTVVVGDGEEIQIRALGALTRAGELGVPSQRGVALAVADYGPIKGHAVSMGAGLDSLCSAAGGAAAAGTVIGDGRVGRGYRHGLLGGGCGGCSDPERGGAGDGGAVDDFAVADIGPAGQCGVELSCRLPSASPATIFTRRRRWPILFTMDWACARCGDP